jgi:D-lactate dehydrogenase
MKTAVFSTKPYDKLFFEKVNASLDSPHELVYFESHLNEETIFLARDFPCVCAFVNDTLNSSMLRQLKAGNTQLLALRSAGFNHVDMKVANDIGLPVVRVPAYSPHAIAEYTIALILTLNRKIPRAHNRVREGNFSLNGLMGFDLYGKTVGIVGTGKIGSLVALLLKAFGCQVLAYDIQPSKSLTAHGVQYVDKDYLLQTSDIISFHCPLFPETRHFIHAGNLDELKDNVMIINTSRGAVLDTAVIIKGLKTKKIGALGLDVYEEEEPLFFEDLSDTIIQDDVFSRLLTFPNVLITGHQAFFTEEAMHEIAKTTLNNITAFENKEPLLNQVLYG